MSLDNNDDFNSKDLNHNTKDKSPNVYRNILKEKNEEINRLREELSKFIDKTNMDNFLSDKDCYKLVPTEKGYGCSYSVPTGPIRYETNDLHILRGICDRCKDKFELSELNKIKEEGRIIEIPFCNYPNKVTRGGKLSEDLSKMFCPKLRGYISIEKCESCKYFEMNKHRMKKKKVIKTMV